MQTVTFFGSVLENTNGEKSFMPEFCANLQGVVDMLSDRYGDSIKELLLDGSYFPLVNGKGIMMTGGLDTPLNPDDRIEILPFVDAG